MPDVPPDPRNTGEPMMWVPVSFIERLCRRAYSNGTSSTPVPPPKTSPPTPTLTDGEPYEGDFQAPTFSGPVHLPGFTPRGIFEQTPNSEEAPDVQ